MRILLISIIALVLAGAGNSARGDGAALGSPAAAVAANWSGPYVGGSFGGRRDRDHWTTTGVELTQPADSGNNPTTFAGTAVRYGLYAGYNWQLSPMWVGGIEGDFAWAGRAPRIYGIPGTFGPIYGAPFSGSDFAQVNDRWDAGVRVRLGYLVRPTTLLFVSAGVSWLRSESSVGCGAPQFWCTASNNATQRVDSQSHTAFGPAVGIGLEQMLTANWLLRGEYRFTDYESWQVALLQDGAAAPPSIDRVDAEIKNRTHTLLIGLAYKIGGPGVPP